MNTVVQAINSAGQAFVDLALPMLVQSSVLILVLLLINLILRRRVRATFRYWIWMVVLVKLVLPPSLWSPVSIGTWFGEEIETPTIAMYEAVEAQRAETDPTPARYSPTKPSTHTDAWVEDLFRNRIERPMPIAGKEDIESQLSQQSRQVQTEAEATAKPTEATDAQPATVAPPSNIHWQGFVLLAWAVVAIALLMLLGQRALFVKDLIAHAQNAPATLQHALDDACTRMGVKRKVQLKVSPNALSPAVCGLFTPTILIPQNIPARLSHQDLQAVLLHELAHVRRGDLWVNLLQTLLQIVYFYNPLLWLANAMICRVREKAVDEAVLVAMGETARHYPETLLTVAKLAFKRRPALSLRLIGVVESKNMLRSRIKHILTRPLPKSAKLGIPGLAVVLLIAAIFLPMAKARPLTDRAAEISTLAREEARRLNHTYIGTEHILLALARQDESVSAKALKKLDVNIDTLRTEVGKLVKPGPKPSRQQELPYTPAAGRAMRLARKEARDLDHDYVGTEHIRLADYRGRHVLLSFWSPTFHPELDRLEKLYTDYRGTEQLQVIGLGGTDTLEEVTNYVKEHDIEWPEIYFGPDWNAELLKKLGGQIQIMLIDPEGKVVATRLRSDKLTDTVRQAVGEPKRATSVQAEEDGRDSAVDVQDCMKQLGLAVALYVKEHDGQLPDTLGPLEPYFSKPGTFAWVREHVTYTGKGSLKDYSKIYAIVTGYETTARPTGQRYVTFLDGHIESVEAKRFKKLRAATISSSDTPTVRHTDERLAWQRTDRYVAPDPERFFPDDVEGGKRLDALFQAVDKDRRGDAEILSTVRLGFRRTTQYRTLILRWIGNRYIWGKDPQNAEAIEIMYHAVPMERHYAIYFGLSVMKHKTPNVLHTLAEICMQGEDVGRITWGLGNQRDEIVPYIEPHLNDGDAQKREIASVLVRHFKDQVDFDQWKESKRQEEARAQFGNRLPEFREALLTGDSRARRDAIDVINRNRLMSLLDDSFLPAMAAAATDPDRKVRNDVGRITGGRWVWGAKDQNPSAIALMLKLASDTDREVRYNAVYYGLSVVRDKTDPIVRRLVEMALVDHENNLYGRIVWGLKGSMQANPERFKAVLAEHIERARSNRTLAASVDTLYRDVLEEDPPKEWNLGDVSKDYPRDLFTISFSPSTSFEPKDTDAVWAEFARTVPQAIVAERMPSFRGRDSKVCTARVQGQAQANAVKKAIEDNPKLVLGRVYPLPVSGQLYLQERFGTAPPVVPSQPATPAPQKTPGPIQQRINAASPGDTVTLEPGVYEEQLVIDKPLTLQGAGWDKTTVMTRVDVTQLMAEMQATLRQRIEAATSDAERKKVAAEVRQEYKERFVRPALLVTKTQGVMIRGIRFSQPGKHVDGGLASLAVLNISDSEVRVVDCAILGAIGNGLHIVDNSNVEIDNALVAATWNTGIVVGEKSTRPSRVYVHDSDIRNCHYAGIRIRPGNDDVRIERCRISGAAWHGIRYDDASPRIENNLIFGSARSGIYASGKTAAVVRDNLFYANEMCGVGCWFQNADTIESNTFIANKRSGLEILGASQPVVRNNIFCNHPTAIMTGDIGDDSPAAKSDGRMNLKSNLLWANEHDAQRWVEREMQPVTLGTETETLRIDPQFADTSSKNFSLETNSPAREAGIGASDLIPFESPWPLQAEESAIIPDGPTRDYRQWKGKD